MINNIFSSLQDLNNTPLSPAYTDYPKSLRLRGLTMIIEEAEDNGATLHPAVESTFASARRSLHLKEKSVREPISGSLQSVLASTMGFENDKNDSMPTSLDAEFVLEKGGLNCDDVSTLQELDKLKNPENNKLGKFVATEPQIASRSPNGDRADVRGLSLENNLNGPMINPLNQKNHMTLVEESSLRNPLQIVYAQAQNELEDFLMIKPLTGNTEASKEGSFPIKNDLISLDPALFPKKIVNYANSLPQDDIADDFRQLVRFIAQDNDKEYVNAKNNSRNEILYSIAFTSQVFSNAKALLKNLSEKLKLEPVSLQVKYKVEIQDIEVNFVKLMRHERSNATPGPFRLKETELEKIIQNIDTLRKEDFILDSREMLNSAHNFYLNLLNEIHVAQNLEDIKFKNGVQIDHITLPKLLDMAIENPGSCGFRKLVIYTYDLYTSPLNLLTYFIFKFFLPRPEGMDYNKFEASKVQILNIMQFWLEVRTPDFILHPDLTLLFDIFLEISQLQDGQNGFEVIDTLDTLSSVYTSVINTVPTKARKTYFSKVLSIDEENNRTLNIKSFSNKKTSAMTIPPFYMCKESLIDNLSVAFLTSECESPEKSSKKKKEKTERFTERIQYNPKSLMERSTDEIARQLTLMDWKIFSHINIREIINKRWTKNEKNSDCPTYWKYVSRFNNFSYWLQYTITSITSQSERMAFVKKFIDVALLCTQRYKNYCSPHYIFSALLSLENFGVISFESPLKEDYEELKETFAPHLSYVHVYEKTFRNARAPAIPSFNFFLKVFLKLQDGVHFKTKLPDSSSCYLKFPILVQVEDYCNEMRRFQKKGFQDKIQKDWNLYRYLKSDFKNEINVNLGDSEAMMEKLMEMVNRSKHRKVRLLDYLFGFQRKDNHGEG